MNFSLYCIIALMFIVLIHPCGLAYTALSITYPQTSFNFAEYQDRFKDSLRSINRFSNNTTGMKRVSGFTVICLLSALVHITVTEGKTLYIFELFSCTRNT